MNEREELDEEWETWELIQNMANVSKRFGFFILFCNFSYFPAIARSCCQAKLPPRHVVDVALSALRVVLQWSHLPVLGVNQTSAEPSASGKHFPRKFEKHLECLCLLKNDI